MNHVIGYAIAIAMPILFYLYIFAIFNKTNAIVEINTFTKSDWYISIFIFVSITCAIAVLIKQNQFIYYWDYGREWTTALSVSDELFANPINALKSIYASINNTDYNQLMPVLIILPLKILGNSFARYVVVNMVFYMCPALFMISLLAYKILHKYQINGTKFWNIVLFVSLTPILYYVLLDGFMDAPVLILISGLLMLSLELDFEKVDIVACVEMAVGILMLVLFRRHFAYWVVGYIVSIFFIAVYHIAKEKDRFRKFKVYVMDMLIIGGICLSVLLTVFRQFFLRSVFNNFSYAYSAYNVTYAEKFERIVVVFGWGVLFMAFILAPIVCRWYRGLFAITIIINKEIYATETGCVTSGPNINLTPGIWTAEIYYEVSDDGNYLDASYYDKNGEEKQYKVWELRREKACRKIKLNIEAGSSNWEIRTFYGGVGEMKIKQILIKKYE